MEQPYRTPDDNFLTNIISPLNLMGICSPRLTKFTLSPDILGNLAQPFGPVLEYAGL